MEQATERKPLHVAEVLALALREGPYGPTEAPPDVGHVQEDAHSAGPQLALALVALAGTGMWMMARRH